MYIEKMPTSLQWQRPDQWTACGRESWEGEGVGKIHYKGLEETLGSDGCVYYLILVMVLWVYTYWTQQSVDFKYVQFVVHQSYLNKTVKNFHHVLKDSDSAGC